jgi:hypothetical protein
MYVYLGPTVASPAFSSLPLKWAKATYGIALANFLIAGSLYSHTAAKLFFIRMFRRTRHLHQHTVLGWGTWTVLIVLANGAAFVLAVGVPIVSLRPVFVRPSIFLRSTPTPPVLCTLSNSSLSISGFYRPPIPNPCPYLPKSPFLSMWSSGASLLPPNSRFYSSHT